MAKVIESVVVNASAQNCFEEWMKFEQFPAFMDYVKSVTHLSNRVWHWVVSGPLGSNLEWDAMMEGKLADRLITWHTTQDSNLDIEGAVTFKPLSDNSTQITSQIEYDPPGGILGEAFANIFSNPSHMVQNDLNNFKKRIEQGAKSTYRV